MKSCIQNLKVGDVVWIRSSPNQYRIVGVRGVLFQTINIYTNREITASVDSFCRVGAMKIVKAK